MKTTISIRYLTRLKELAVMSPAEREEEEGLPSNKAQHILTAGTKKAISDGIKKRKTLLVCPLTTDIVSPTNFNCYYFLPGERL